MAKLTPRMEIKEAGKILTDLFTEELSKIGDEMVKQAMSAWRDGKKSLGELKWPGEMEYRARVRDTLTLLASQSILKARSEVPKAKNVKLFDENESILFAATSLIFDKLPKDVRDFITKQCDLLVGTQLGDLERNLKFQYLDSFGTTDSELLFEEDMTEVCVDYIDGNSVRNGANLLASKTVNEARQAFFFDDETLEEIDAFEFVNGDPVTDICNDLAGKVFAKDDPNMWRYTPPLHWNCKSYIVPILKGKLGRREIEKLKPSTKKLEEQIQFSECGCCGHTYLTENPK